MTKMRQFITNESDWQETFRPTHMLRFLGENAWSERKKNLVIVACFRRIWHLLKTTRGHRAVEVYEQFIEGKATEEELAIAKEDAWQSSAEIPNPEGNKVPEQLALGAIGLHFDYRDMLMGASDATAWAKVGTTEPATDEPEERAQSVLVREIFGNPFRPVAFNPAWRTSTVMSLAQSVYEERQLPSGLFDNQRLGVLADALEEAGCDNADILGHLRGGEEHVRGCHVIDLILGKE
jgi:hypothetical protein